MPPTAIAAPGLSLTQIVLFLLVAVLGSSALAAWITTRGTLRVQTTNHVATIESEVRQNLRKELEQAEREMEKMREENARMSRENAQLLRKMDRVTDNLVRFARNVCRLSRLVKTLLPNDHRVLAEEVDAEAKRLVKLLGEEFEPGQDEERVTEIARAP